MIIIEPIRDRHFRDLAEEFAGAPFTNPNIRDALIAESKSVAFVEEGGKTQALLGVVDIHEGVGQVYAAYSRNFKNNPRRLATLTLSCLYNLLDECGYHRIEMTIPADDEKLLRWALFLGMVNEGVLRKWGADKKDYVMLSMTKEELV